MAFTPVERSSAFNELFKDISGRFSPAESEDVVQSSKRIYGEQFNSLGNQDLLSCFDLLHKLSYVTSTNLTLMKKFVATKSKNEDDINKQIKSFENSHPHQAEPEKKLQGRSGEIKKITERLEVGQPPVVNVYGSAGVGKTTLAKEVCAKWNGQSHVFDLREAKDMRAIYVNIMGTLGITVPVGHLSMDYVVQRIHDQVVKKSEGQPVMFLLDNVEEFTRGQGKEGKNLRTAFMQFLGKLSEFDGKSRTGKLNILLTSRTQLNNSERVFDYELEALEDSFSEKILFPMETSNVNAQQKEKLLGICKGLPLLLEGTGAILRLGRKSASDLIGTIEKLKASQGGADHQVKSKVEEEAKEKPFDFQEEGVDAGQTSIIKEMFDTLPSDILRVSAVSISLFCGPFSASTAAKVLGISPSEAVAQLEGLVNNAIIHVVDQEAKELMYDIHPLLKKYAESMRNDAKFCESYAEAKGRFYEHFMSKMKNIAGLIESNYVKAFNEFARDQLNYEFAINISLLPEYFSIPGEFLESAMIASLFNAVLSGEKQTELFHSWADMCKDDGKSASLVRAQLRCWEARQVLDVDGTHKAFKVLQQASSSLEQVQDQSTESFKLTQGLFMYSEGEIYCQNRDYKKAIQCLESSLDLMEELLKLDTNLARCYNALGKCYYRLGKTEKSLEFYNKALNMQEELSGSEYHYDMPVYKNQIGTVHEYQGEYNKAEKCYKDALKLLERLKISGYEDEALICRNLANVYIRQGKYEEAFEPAHKAYNIRMKRLGEHPDTVQSIFQQGVIQANLRAFDKALDYFLKAWEMEKSLKAGNRSDVWRLIITGVFDMCDKLKPKKDTEKEEFRQDALLFCQHFWKEERATAQFSFTEYNKNLIDAILFLLGSKKKKRALRDEFEKEALWFYDGMQRATEVDFYDDFDLATDNNVLNEMLRERKEFLDKLIEFCHQEDQHEKVIEHKRNKLMLYEKVLVRVDFVGEEGLEKATLKNKAEQLYKDLGEKRNIKEFQEKLLTIWIKQWDDGKRAEETNEMFRKRLIKSIVQLCKELKNEELCNMYGKEALSFFERLLETKHTEMELPVMIALVNDITEMASLIGEPERVMVDCLTDVQVPQVKKKGYIMPAVASRWRWHLSITAEKEDFVNKNEDLPSILDRESLMVAFNALQTLSNTWKVARATLGPKEQLPGEANVDYDDHEDSNDVSENENSDDDDDDDDDKNGDDDGNCGGEDDNEDDVGNVGSEGVTEEQELPQQLHGLQVEEQEEHLQEQDQYKTKIHEGIVTSEGAYWALKQEAVHLMFPPNAVSEPTTMVVHKIWKCSPCSPPLQDHEAIVSNVIEISTINGQALEFNADVKLFLSHSAQALPGYELVIKRQIDKECNKWEDIDGTQDLRCLSDIGDRCLSPNATPDFFFPVAQAGITKCSTYTVVCRLKSSPPSTITCTSTGGSFSHPDYSGVTVTNPENAVAPEANFPLQSKGILRQANGQVHIDNVKVLAQPNREYSSSNPLKVTILATQWKNTGRSLLLRELAKQLAKFPHLKVVMLVPENSWYSEKDKREAESLLYQFTIVEAKGKEGIPEPIEWLNFPPGDLSTDIVVECDENLCKIARSWKEHYQCKHMHIASYDAWQPLWFRSLFCRIADIPVAIGPKTSEELSASLSRDRKKVFNLTPGIISAFCNLTHVENDRGNFRVLLIDGDNPDNFQKEGLDIAAEAVKELNDKSFRLIYVGAGERNMGQFAQQFHDECGISKAQLEIRSLPKDDEEWKRLFCEVDLAIMPSGEKDFGLEALLALSAGLPVLVHADSGFGEALKEVVFGASAIVDSDVATEWAMEIKKVKERDRKTRLDGAAKLRSHYDERYSWEKQCGDLVGRFMVMFPDQENPEVS